MIEEFDRNELAGDGQRDQGAAIVAAGVVDIAVDIGIGPEIGYTVAEAVGTVKERIDWGRYYDC